MVLCFSGKPKSVELDNLFRIKKSSHSTNKPSTSLAEKQSVKGIIKFLFIYSELLVVPLA